MVHIAKMVSMVKAAKADGPDASPPTPAVDNPIYPYGLCISLCEDELDKLGLEADCDIGDTVHLFCMAKVTSVSQHESQNGKHCRVELQITDMAVESEDEENESYDDDDRKKNRYGGSPAEE